MTHNHILYRTPLRHRDTVQAGIKPWMPSKKVRELEEGFVLDAVVAEKQKSRWNPIIPSYNALRDKYCQAYFQSPQVKKVMKLTVDNEEPYETSRSLNKLSERKRVLPTPPVTKLRQRENRFKLDCIIAEKTATRYKPMIQPYDATRDPHAQTYFQRPGVRETMDMTCTLKPFIDCMDVHEK
ncbi:uncharacterized protein [Ptychodera flava]|uniref:uncharacterized protein isoform X2 n=1 Tax=Ptychodera flava TaxID=63121 RepID=UPI00396A6F11